MTNTRKTVATMTFAEACAAWYATAEKYADTGACDTEPRAEFAEIVIALAEGRDPVVPQRASGWKDGSPAWQLYSTSKEGFFAGKALTRAAERVVKVAQRVGIDEVRAYATAQGWFW